MRDEQRTNFDKKDYQPPTQKDWLLNQKGFIIMRNAPVDLFWKLEDWFHSKIHNWEKKNFYFSNLFDLKKDYFSIQLETWPQNKYNFKEMNFPGTFTSKLIPIQSDNKIISCKLKNMKHCLLAKPFWMIS